MQRVKSMEKLFLGTFFADDELDIIDQKYVNSPVFFTEFIHLDDITASDAVDDFVGKHFRRYIKNLHVWILFQYEAPDRMHQVRLAKTCSSIDIERIVYFARGFGHCQRSRVGEFIVAAYDKSIEFIFWIQVCVLIFHIIDRVVFVKRAFHHILFQNKSDIVGMVHHLRYGYLKITFIFGRDIVESMSLIGRDDDHHHVILYLIEIKRNDPGIVGNIRKLIFLPQRLFY